jgi:hypothetical protein
MWYSELDLQRLHPFLALRAFFFFPQRKECRHIRQLTTPEVRQDAHNDARGNGVSWGQLMIGKESQRSVIANQGCQGEGAEGECGEG